MSKDLSAQIRSSNEALIRFTQVHGPSESYIKELDIQVGQGDHEKYVQEMKLLGEKVLFCTGSRAMRAAGFLDRYLSLFKQEGFKVRHYDDISANPTLKQMVKGVGVANDFQPDFIFALGGGSTIDTAKAIAAGAYGDLWKYVIGESTIEQAIPIVALSTTSGTGSHLTPYAVVTNTDTLEKRTLKHPLLCPKRSLVDIEILESMPKRTLAETGFDVLAHAAEVFTRTDSTEASTEASITALQLIRENLVGSYNEDIPQNKLGMAFADIYAGIALALVGTHVPHAISHPISARHEQISHGQTLAYLLPETFRVQRDKLNPALNYKFEIVSDELGGSSDICRTLLNFTKLLGLDNRKSFSSDDRANILNDTMGYRYGSVLKSPVTLSRDDIELIIKNSL